MRGDKSEPDLQPALPRRPLFDPLWYVLNNPGLELGTHDAYRHYITIGHKEGILPGPFTREAVRFGNPAPEDWWLVERSTLFDSDWYGEKYGVPPGSALDDFMREGAYLGCDPNPFFSCQDYIEDSRDAFSVGYHPLVHYLRHGATNVSPTFARRFANRLDLLDECAWRYGRV